MLLPLNCLSQIPVPTRSCKQTIFTNEFHCKNRHLGYKEQSFTLEQVESSWGLDNDNFLVHLFHDFSSLSQCVWDSHFQSAIHSCTCRALLTLILFWDAICQIPANKEIKVTLSMAVDLQNNEFVLHGLKRGLNVGEVSCIIHSGPCVLCLLFPIKCWVTKYWEV